MREKRDPDKFAFAFVRSAAKGKTNRNLVFGQNAPKNQANFPQEHTQ